MNKLVHMDNYGLYRDNGLICVPANTRANDINRKKLFEVLKNLGFKINVKIVKFLDVELDFDAGTISPYVKLNINIIYVNTKSNHPANVIMQIPKGVERISHNSSAEEIFNLQKKVYEKALKREGHNTVLSFSPPVRPKCTTRRRDVIWFNLPINMQLKTKIGKVFFKLLDKHFLRNSVLAKVLRVTKQLLNIIKRHNTRLLQAERVGKVKTKLCNCRDSNNCPLDGRCLIEGVVYSAKSVIANFF